MIRYRCLRQQCPAIGKWMLVVLLLSHSLVRAKPNSAIVLTDVTGDTGIDFKHTDGSSGGYYIVETVCAGLALFDYDNDGDVDVVVLNSRREPTLMRNDSPKQGHWLQVRLRGTKTNRDGVGAGVTVTAGDVELVDEVHSGCGYQSHYGTRLYFGLGENKSVDRIEVRWTGGATEVFRDITADRLVTLVEGKGEQKAAGK